MASDAVPNESVDHRDVLAHQKFASFLSSQASHESANVVNLSVSEAKNFFRIFVFVLINAIFGVDQNEDKYSKEILRFDQLQRWRSAWQLRLR